MYKKSQKNMTGPVLTKRFTKAKTISRDRPFENCKISYLI
jgi:hypothetical protein